MPQDEANDKRQEEQITPCTATRSPWEFASASLALSAATLYLARLYGYLHWQVLSRAPREVPDAMRSRLFNLLGQMEWYRLFGLLAAVFAILALFRRPRWLAIIYVPPALLALFEATVIM